VLAERDDKQDRCGKGGDRLGSPCEHGRRAEQYRRLSFHAWMPDSELPPGPSLEQRAAEAGVDYWTVRAWLEREVARRRQERYRMHGHAIARLDARLKRLGQRLSRTNRRERATRQRYGAVRRS
jgi:hypothetical protein